MDDGFSHDSDFLVWTERQARALRALAPRRADLPNELDLENLAEEIEDLGRSEFNSVKSHLRNIMLHLIKSACAPGAPAIPHWSAESRAFHRSLLDKFSPSMRARLDLPTLWRDAREDALDDMLEAGRAPPPGLPLDCPWTLDEFTRGKLDFPALLARLAGPA